MRVVKNNFWRIVLNTILVAVFLFCIFYDLSLSNIGFPFLTTVFFVILIGYRFLKPYLR